MYAFNISQNKHSSCIKCKSRATIYSKKNMICRKSNFPGLVAMYYFVLKASFSHRPLFTDLPIRFILILQFRAGGKWPPNFLTFRRACNWDYSWKNGVQGVHLSPLKFSFQSHGVRVEPSQGLLYRWTEHSILPMPTGG